MYRILACIVTIIAMTGCAGKSTHKGDPWEQWNRKVYDFNKSVDKTIAKPLTQGYKAVTPDIVEQGISNVFANLGDIPTMVNNLLQGKVVDSMSDLGRIVINSTIGIAGLWDPATEMGLMKHDEDFGQTLGAWGMNPGPYIMLPFLGPSTLRDTAAFPADSKLDLFNQINHIPTRNQLTFLQLVDQRSALMKYEDQLRDVADEYAFIRDFYLQNRRYKVLDGNIPFEDDCENPDDCDF
ncbi:VacJ family lipoprotein [Aliikangiella maris]|uniref:VacJ family lipoprotein n=2 Tax=Aliikangiella maris TaxID=3162458 RepID=A0ABV3MPU3_9GAMM